MLTLRQKTDRQQGSETLPPQEENTRNVSILLTNTKQSETLPLPSIQQLQEEALLKNND